MEEPRNLEVLGDGLVVRYEARQGREEGAEVRGLDPVRRIKGGS